MCDTQTKGLSFFSSEISRGLIWHFSRAEGPPPPFSSNEARVKDILLLILIYLCRVVSSHGGALNFRQFELLFLFFVSTQMKPKTMFFHWWRMPPRIKEASTSFWIKREFHVKKERAQDVNFTWECAATQIFFRVFFKIRFHVRMPPHRFQNHSSWIFSAMPPYPSWISREKREPNHE